MRDGYKQLAASVILRAVEDYRRFDSHSGKNIRVSDRDQGTAAAFLKSKDDLRFWCHIAGLRSKAVREGVFGRKSRRNP